MMRTLLIALLLCTSSVHSSCPNQCSFNGKCVSSFCECFDGFTGGDCSQRLCPSTEAWVDVASGTDPAHARAECANMGLCDRGTGKCTCRKGFTGAACSRMECPGGKTSCSGHGRCVTIERAASEEGVSYSIWDKDRIMGCICDEGWTEYDCSRRTCPRGDDPLTTGQVDEIQELTCDSTSGTLFYLQFRGAYTVSLDASSATPSDVETALNALSTIHEVSVQHVTSSGLGSADLVCASAGGRTVEVTFLTEHNDVPLLLGSSLDGVSITVSEQVKGTKEDAICNNRGFCEDNPSSHWSGQCRCVDHRIVKFTSSNGKGETDGLMGDCGVRGSDFNDRCPTSLLKYDETNYCSGHGDCDDSGGSPTYACTCYEGWTGHNCEQRTCPFGNAWFSVPETTNEAHTLMECSNRGICNRGTGLCECQDMFEGTACERLKCASGSNGKTCSGYGVCATIAEIASLRVVNGELTPASYGSVANDLNTWDAHRLQGCICNSRTHAYASPSTGRVPTWSGFDCSIRGCPRGPRPPPDHQTCVQDVFEEQKIVCTSDGTTQLELTFRDRKSVSFQSDVDATGVGSLQVYLESLLSIGRVNVTYTAGTSLCTSDGSNEVMVTFLTELGDVPMLSLTQSQSDGVTTSISIVESTKGTKEDLECSDLGHCDRITGLCTCFSGFSSSDGDGNPGTRGDCGYRF